MPLVTATLVCVWYVYRIRPAGNSNPGTCTPFVPLKWYMYRNRTAKVVRVPQPYQARIPDVNWPMNWFMLSGADTPVVLARPLRLRITIAVEWGWRLANPCLAI